LLASVLFPTDIRAEGFGGLHVLSLIDRATSAATLKRFVNNFLSFGSTVNFTAFIKFSAAAMA
jgi:hypothetical protein